jgi:hypothetical protein
MPFLEIYKRVEKHVRGTGGDPSFFPGSPISNADLKRLRTKSALPIPDSVIDFYREVGDGVFFYWKRESDGAYGCMSFPKLREFIVPSLDVLKWRLEWNDSYDYRYTKDPKRAKATGLRMRGWLAFDEEGNGDRFCIETGDGGGSVVFDKHDWMDGGPGHNGTSFGRTLLEFVAAWSRVCFMSPKCCWWPSVITKDGEVDWGSNEFREEFRLPSTA